MQSLSFCSVPSACCCLTCLASCSVCSSCSLFISFSLIYSFIVVVFSAQSHLLAVFCSVFFPISALAIDLSPSSLAVNCCLFSIRCYFSMCDFEPESLSSIPFRMLFLLFFLHLFFLQLFKFDPTFYSSLKCLTLICPTLFDEL